MTTVTLALAGLVGSVYSHELRQQLAMLVGGYPAAVFTVMLCVSGLALWSNTELALRQQDKIFQDFRDQNAALEKHILRVQTMPPEAVIQEMIPAFEASLVLTRKCLADEDPTQVMTGIRSSLRAVANLGTLWHEQAAVKFGTSLMLPLDCSDEAWASKLKFVERDGGGRPVTATLEKMLIFSSQLVEPATNAAGPILDFAIPVPRSCGRQRDEDGRGGWRVLPGAPFAFALRRISFYSNTHEIGTWLEEQSDGVPEAIRHEVIAYFQAHRQVFVSFVSIPIFKPSSVQSASGEREVIAILNVHWDIPGYLNDDRTVELFAKALGPYRSLIGILVQELMAGKAVPKPIAE